MNYTELSNFEINKAVAKAQGLKVHPEQARFETLWSDSVIAQDWLSGRFVEFNYCDNPRDAWPIIIKNNIMIIPRPKGHIGMPTAKSWSPNSHSAHCKSNSKLLRAAMIVFLKIKNADLDKRDSDPKFD